MNSDDPFLSLNMSLADSGTIRSSTASKLRSRFFSARPGALTSVVILLLISCCLNVRAALYSQGWSTGFANGGNIPDGNPTGWSDTRPLSGITDFAIMDVSVTLNISGGYNGDLYAYLSHNGVLVPLLNRVGVTATGGGSAFGYSDAGFNVTLSSSGANNVHFYNNFSPTITSGQLTGTWQPDGRAIDPASPPATFDSTTPIGFGAYTNMNPNGTWTLFISDMSGGDQSQLTAWSLGIEAVPEPIALALPIFGVVVAVAHFVRRRLLAATA